MLRIWSVVLCLCLFGQVVAEGGAGELTLDQAERLVSGAIEKAEELDLRIAVAVVDQHGNLKAFRRMDGSYLVAAKSAEMKAFTSASVPFSTKQIADLVAGDPNHALTAVPGFLLLEGGLPIISESGVHIGGIGVGGGSGEQDAQCAQAGLDKLKSGKVMKKTSEELPAMRLAGRTVRTNNAAEADWMAGEIFPCVMAYFHEGVAETIPNRKRPGVTICAYTDYESDHTGDYTYFVGEEVSAEAELPEGLEWLVIPAQNYAKFTTEPGAMPDVLRNAWEEIWEMGPAEFGAPRRYHTDFELYDERAADEQNVVLDLYIGLD